MALLSIPFTICAQTDGLGCSRWLALLTVTALGSPVHLKHSLVIEYGADRDKPLVPRGNVLRGFMVLAVDAVAIKTPPPPLWS